MRLKLKVIFAFYHLFCAFLAANFIASDKVSFGKRLTKYSWKKFGKCVPKFPGPENLLHS
jgi:hypothetical protein